MSQNWIKPVAKPEASGIVRFWAFTVGNGLTGFNRLANNFFLSFAEKYNRPDGKQDFRNPTDIQFEGGIYQTDDTTIIKFLDKYIKDHPNGEFRISRTEPALGSDNAPARITETVTIEKKVIPFAVTQLIPLEMLKELLLKECGFVTKPEDTLNEVIAAAIAEKHIMAEPE